MSGSAQNQGTKSQVHSDDVPSSTKSADASSSTDAATATAVEGGSGDNQEDGAGGSERPAASPEPNCAICLGQLENKSFTDSCFHMFCFVCLQEWSKVKAECPLCKQPFKSIIHNVKSYNNYDQFYLDHHHRPSQPLPFGWNFDRSFHYRTTLTMDHRYFNLPSILNEREMTNRQPSVPIYRRSIMPRYRLRSRTVHPLVRPYPEPVSTTNFRRQIYESGRRVSCLGSTHRRRKVSPEFFSANPAQTHRLVPWLNRELNALLYNAEGQVTFVLELIMGLIKRFRIDSDEFYEHIHPYLHHFTRHFIHEFLHFARSPYTMQTYDTKVIYQETSQTVSSSDSTASNSDVVVVDDDDDEQPNVPHHQWDEIVSPWHSPPSSSVPSTSALARSRWDSPTPGPSWDLSGNSSHSPVNVDGSSDSDASTIIDPTYIAPEASRSQPAGPPSPESSDAEEVIFLSYDKPWEERSPIQLSSGSDSETSHFIKALKQENNKRKKARSLSGVSEASRKSRDRGRERSRSPTSPAASHQHSRPQQSSSGQHQHGSSTSTSSKSKDRLKKKKSHHDKSEETRHSSRSGHKEKRKSSHSHTSLPLKKRRLNKEGNEDGLEHSRSHKKHKHKKHKNKERRDKRSKRQHDPDDERSGNSLGALDGAASSMSTDRADHCKKHPSGHKKSRVKNTGDAGQEKSKEENSGHHSDSLLSDTSTSSGHSSTATTTSLTDSDSAPARQFSRQQRVQQVLQERQRMTHLPQVPSLLDLPDTWENITRLASMLASRSPGQLAAMPGPSQSADDPVVISTSSDESDAEDPVQKVRADHMSSDSMPVAKTVVVPCSSNPEIPTPAIDYANAPASTSSAPRPLVVDSYIDVESISSEQETSDLEVVDVESISDSSSGLSHSKANPSRQADPDFADSRAPETVMSYEPITFSSGEGTSAASADVRPATGGSEMGKQIRILNPCSVAAVKQSKMPRAQKSSLHMKNPFSIDFILGQDVLLGSSSRSALFSRQKSAATRSSQHSSLPSQDATHSHTQSHLNPRAVVFKSDLSQQQEEAVQTPLSSVVDRLARECHARALTEYKAGQDEEIDVLSQQQEEAVQTPLSSVVDRLARECHARALTEYKAGQDEEIDVLSQQQEEAVQTPLSSVVDRLARECHARALTEYKAGQDEEIDVLNDSLSSSLAAVAQPCTEDSPAPPSVSEWGRQSRSPATPGHSSDTCPPPSPLSQPGSGPSPDTPASENIDNPYLSPVISQPDTENLSKVCQGSPENTENGDHVKGKETKLSDEAAQDSMDQNYANNHNDNCTDLKDFSDEEMDFGCIADRQVRALECSFFEESKEKEIGALSELENSIDFPANDSLKNETDEANVSESQNDVKKLTDDKKCEDEEMDLLKGSVSAEVDEQVEKLLLCEDVNVCAPDLSDQEKNTDDHINSVSTSEQNNDCKSHTESENSALNHNQSNSCASQSEVGASSTSSADHLGKGFHASLSADSKVVSPVAETNPDSSITTSMQSCPDDVDSSSMVCPAADGLDPCVEFSLPSVRTVRTAEQNSISPDQEGSDLCENSAAQCVLNQDREQPATCDSSLECQANSRP